MADLQPALLLILDGFGYREAAPDNAITLAQCPNWRSIWGSYPHTLIRTDGKAVGLPVGQMGNSEVGHMNLGAGRIAQPELTRIEIALEDGSFFENSALNQACTSVLANKRTLHVLGLLSPGGVHSHENQIFALLKLAKERGVAQVVVHAFLDGRDMPPRSAEPSLRKLEALCSELGQSRIASVGGRFFGMDRDQRFERLEQHWRAIVDADAPSYGRALEALQAAYERGENDEFVSPCVIGAGASIEDGDAVVFMNFRADRARQLTQALCLPSFTGFTRKRVPKLISLVTLTEYQKGLPVQVAYPPSDMPNTLAEIVSNAGHRQLRIAETEKYAHVTFFFSGGREAEFPGEERILVPSPKVKSYDLKPEMSCPEVTEQLVQALKSKRFGLLVCNLANPDMVGHTGNVSAAVRAVEAVDRALGELLHACQQSGTELLITADHGNLEEMWDRASNQPNTQHSTYPVPLVYIGKPKQLREGGALQDIAPTLLAIMGLSQPPEMTGRSLLMST
jgi:2,3-bisphosphoglycerate-independent phosphoglycerate mutase